MLDLTSICLLGAEISGVTVKKSARDRLRFKNRFDWFYIDYRRITIKLKGMFFFYTLPTVKECWRSILMPSRRKTDSGSTKSAEWFVTKLSYILRNVSFNLWFLCPNDLKRFFFFSKPIKNYF